MKDFDEPDFTDEEKQVNRDLEAGMYVPTSEREFLEIKRAIDAHKRDKVLTIRVNSEDLRLIKEKAKKLGVKYQKLISEVLHRIANS